MQTTWQIPPPPSSLPTTHEICIPTYIKQISPFQKKNKKKKSPAYSHTRNTHRSFWSQSFPNLCNLRARELGRASDGACKFSYVPTPYFSFLVGTQRDILSVEPFARVVVQPVRRGPDVTCRCQCRLFLSFLGALGSYAEQPFSTSDRTLRKGEEGNPTFSPCRRSYSRRPAKTSTAVYTEAETPTWLMKSFVWMMTGRWHKVVINKIIYSLSCVSSYASLI